MVKHRAHRLRRRSSRARNRRRSRNSGFMMRSHRRHGRRLRNPARAGFLGGTISNVGSLMIWGTAGAVASRAIPASLLSSYNSGFTGYGLNLATAIVGGALVGRFAGSDKGAKFTAGGVIATALRIFSDQFSNYASQFGLGGDLGFYIPNSFPVPTSGSGPFLLNAGYAGASPAASGPVSAAAAVTPAAGASVAAPVASGDEPTRWANRWAS